MRDTPFLLAVLLFPEVLHSQITRENYYSYVPAMPKLVTQTAASAQLNLYGDKNGGSYSDADANGIDDRRQLQLQNIADRFSPVLRRNNFSFPRDFKRVLGERDILFVDTWRAGRYVKSEEIRLGWSAASRASGDAESQAALQAIVAATDPLKPDERFIAPDNYEERILFVDYPGHDPASWRAAYRDGDQRKLLSTRTFSFMKTRPRADRRVITSSPSTGSSIHSTTPATTTRAIGST